MRFGVGRRHKRLIASLVSARVVVVVAERERERERKRERDCERKDITRRVPLSNPKMSSSSLAFSTHKAYVYLFTRHGEHDRAPTTAMMIVVVAFLVVVFYVVARFQSRHPPFLLSIINKEREEEEGLTKCKFFCFWNPKERDDQSLVSHKSKKTLN